MPLPPLQSPTRPARVLSAWLKAIPAALLLGLTLAAGNLAQMASVLVLPFSTRVFRFINRSIANGWWSLCVHFARHFHGTRVEVHGEDLPAGENAVVIVNHQSMADIPVLLDYAYSQGRLGDMKWYVKDILKYVPGIGWGMLFLDCLFIKRNWTADKGLIERVFRRIVKGEVPLWIVSFLEGTRNKPAKLARSQEYARANDLPVLEHVLVPRTKGFLATLRGLEGHVHAVYDLTIGYVDAVPSLGQWFLGYVPRVHLHVRRTSSLFSGVTVLKGGGAVCLTPGRRGCIKTAGVCAGALCALEVAAWATT